MLNKFLLLFTAAAAHSNK